MGGAAMPNMMQPGANNAGNGGMQQMMGQPFAMDPNNFNQYPNR